MKKISKKKEDFNNFRFEGLNWKQKTNNYLTMDRVSADENKIVVKIAEDNLCKTKYGYAVILDRNHVVFVKDWAVSINYYGAEVMLTREYFNVKQWGSFDDFGEGSEEERNYEHWLNIAKEQAAYEYTDEDGDVHKNIVHWEF